MITKFNMYTNLLGGHIGQPKIGDHVIITDERSRYDDLDEQTINSYFNFIHNNIGEVVEVFDHSKPVVFNYRKIFYNVSYDKVPNSIKSMFTKIKGERGYTREVYDNQIVDFSGNKEDLQVKIQTKKFNL